MLSQNRSNNISKPGLQRQDCPRFQRCHARICGNGEDGKDGVDGNDGKDGVKGPAGDTPLLGAKRDTDGNYYWTVQIGGGAVRVADGWRR